MYRSNARGSEKNRIRTGKRVKVEKNTQISFISSRSSDKKKNHGSTEYNTRTSKEGVRLGVFFVAKLHPPFLSALSRDSLRGTLTNRAPIETVPLQHIDHCRIFLLQIRPEIQMSHGTPQNQP